MRVAIVGSRKWTNQQKIKDFIFLLKKEFGEELEIVSGGCQYGADFYAKKFAKELEVKYIEFPPVHAKWNPDCPLPKYLYSKEYNVGNFFARNKQVAEYADKIAAFIPKNHESKGTMNTIGYAKKLNKPYVIVN